MSAYEKLIDDAPVVDGVHIIVDEVHFAWSVGWDNYLGCFVGTAISIAVDPPIACREIGMTRAGAAEKALDAYFDAKSDREVEIRSQTFLLEVSKVPTDGPSISSMVDRGYWD